MQRSNTGAAILILGALFFIFGFVTWLNGTLIPYLKLACELDTAQALWVTFAFYISYFFMALPSSWILQRTGLKNGMMLGLFVMAAGALLFIPAAHGRAFGLFLAGLFIIGTGLALLQTASNPYITVVGPIESAASRISIMGICNKVAGVLAPLVLGAIVLSDADVLTQKLATMDVAAKAAQLNELASRVVLPYSVMALVLVGLGLMVRFSPLPELDLKKAAGTGANDHRGLFSFPNLILGVIALFLYVGVEVMAGDTIGIYGQTQGVPLSEAKHLTSYTLIAMVVGYVIGITCIPRIFSQSTALLGSAALGTLITLTAIFIPGYPSVLCIALLGLANALVWPAIWPLAINGLGRHTENGSAMLIMAIAGGAVLPKIYGALADMPRIGHQQAYWIMVPCYLFIGWYALSGHKRRSAAAT